MAYQQSGSEGGCPRAGDRPRVAVWPPPRLPLSPSPPRPVAVTVEDEYEEVEVEEGAWCVIPRAPVVRAGAPRSPPVVGPSVRQRAAQWEAQQQQRQLQQRQWARRPPPAQPPPRRWAEVQAAPARPGRLQEYEYYAMDTNLDDDVHHGYSEDSALFEVEEFVEIQDTPRREWRNPRQRFFGRAQATRRLNFDGYSDDRQVNSTAEIPQETQPVQQQYATVPSFVIVAKHLDEGYFWGLIDLYFKYGEWVDYDLLPDSFKEACRLYDVGPDSYEEMPGFAPKWMYFLREMDERVFKAAVDFFFDEKMLPSWDVLPPFFPRAFQLMNITEFEFF